MIHTYPNSYNAPTSRSRVSIENLIQHPTLWFVSTSSTNMLMNLVVVLLLSENKKECSISLLEICLLQLIHLGWSSVLPIYYTGSQMHLRGSITPWEHKFVIRCWYTQLINRIMTAGQAIFFATLIWTSTMVFLSATDSE